MSRFQQLAPLRPEEREALKADIAKRGVLVPVEVDEDGNLLDGFHRTEIAAELGLEAPRIVRAGWSEQEKLEHSLKINLLRRHLGPVSWGDAFRKLAEARGVRMGSQGRQSEKTATVAVLAEELGVPERTARHRVKMAEALSSHPDLFEAADTGSMTVKEAVREVRKRDRREQAPPSGPVPPVPDGVQLDVADACALPLDDETVDLIVTSPPYGLDKPYPGIPDPALGWAHWMMAWLEEAYRVTKDGGRLGLNVPLDTSRGGFRPTYAEAVTAARMAGWTYRSTIVWWDGDINKSTARGSVDSPSSPHVIAPVEMIALFSKGHWAQDGPGESDLTHEEWLAWTMGVWQFHGESRAWEGHPAAFPTELPRRLITLLTRRGELVLDPFVGSGTTALVARQLGRRVIGFDLNPDYIASATRRLEQRID